MDTNLISIVHAAIKAYAEQRPRPTHVTQSQAAEMLGKSKPTIAKMVRAGTLRLNACGMIPIEMIDKARD